MLKTVPVWCQVTNAVIDPPFKLPKTFFVLFFEPRLDRHGLVGGERERERGRERERERDGIIMHPVTDNTSRGQKRRAREKTEGGREKEGDGGKERG